MTEPAAAEQRRIEAARESVSKRRKATLLLAVAESLRPEPQPFDWAAWRLNRMLLAGRTARDWRRSRAARARAEVQAAHARNAARCAARTTRAGTG